MWFDAFSAPKNGGPNSENQERVARGQKSSANVERAFLPTVLLCSEIVLARGSARPVAPLLRPTKPGVEARALEGPTGSSAPSSAGHSGTTRRVARQL